MEVLDDRFTNGCQQGLDLLERVLVRAGDAVAIEDPVYPGLKNLFERAGARLAGVPMTGRGLCLLYTSPSPRDCS